MNYYILNSKLLCINFVYLYMFSSKNKRLKPKSSKRKGWVKMEDAKSTVLTGAIFVGNVVDTEHRNKLNHSNSDVGLIVP